MEFKISEDALSIIKELRANSFNAYIVGGAVRDMVMQKQPHDYDITTDALPQDVKRIFSKTVDTGIELGTVSVIKNNVAYEVTTYRTEDDYKDFRHPQKVSFTKTLEEDLKRRDFTINAMCYSQEEGIIDLYGGKEDIKRKIIKTVGNPKERFLEDALRMLRAVRFSAVLGFEIEKETQQAIKELSHLIKNVSKERILGELNKILLSDNPEFICKGCGMYLMKYIMKELYVCFHTPQRNKYHIYNVGDHIMCTVASTKKNLVLRWAALLHDVGKPTCASKDAQGIIHFYGHHRNSTLIGEDILRRLGMDNQTRKEILELVENHDVRIEPTPAAVKKMLSKLSDKLFLQLLELQIADNMAKNSAYFKDKKKKIQRVKSIYERIKAEGQPYMLSHLVINGRDLIKIGFKAGREIGDTLKKLLNEVMVSPQLNNREYLLKRAKELKRKR